jgi:hypothetical protein
MKHQEMIKWFDWDIDSLARAIVDLRYDKTTELFHAITRCLAEDSLADLQRNRKELSCALLQASNDSQKAAKSMEDVWNICKAHM